MKILTKLGGERCNKLMNDVDTFVKVYGFLGDNSFGKLNPFEIR